MRKSVGITYRKQNRSKGFMVRTNNSMRSSIGEFKQQISNVETDTAQTHRTHNFFTKYTRFVQYQPPETEENPKILKKDTNYLESLSGFEKIETLGKGSYAKVYHIKNKRTNESFALKIYPKSYFTKPHRIQNIRSEVFLLSNLRHENIVPLLHIHESLENVRDISRRYTSSWRRAILFLWTFTSKTNRRNE